MKKRLFPIVLSAAILMAGCSAGTNSQTSTTQAATDTTIMIATETAAVTTADITVSTTTEPIATTAETTTVFIPVLPLAENTSGKVQIQTVAGGSSFKFNSYIITSAEGETIVVDPTEMPSVELVDLKPAAIVSTHMHSDHSDSVYTDSYDCQKIISEKADITTSDFHIYTIPSSHLGDIISDKAPSNYMVVIEVDGLRIAHLGDLGQTALTEDQLAQLGDIDIVFAQFDNMGSIMSIENMKGFNLIEQLNPKIIIPTHYSDVDVPVFEEYGPITEIENVLTISKDDIPADPLHVYRISNGHIYSND